MREPEPDFALVGRNMVARNQARLHEMQGMPGNRAERRARARQIQADARRTLPPVRRR